MTTADADTRFLKRILFLLVAATLASGMLAGVATVKAGSQTPNFSLFASTAK